MRILWHSNAPFVPTGYGKQTQLFVPRIAEAGHDVAVSAFFGAEGAILEWRGFRLYPTDITRYGRAMLPQYVEHWADDLGCKREDILVMTLLDVWVLKAGWDDLNVASWTPVDHHPVPPRVYEYFARSGARPIAMSQFGKKELENQGLDPLYVPHGVDTNEYYPWPASDRPDIRAGLGIPKDAFVVGMVANNKGTAPPRKAFPQVFQAFAEFRRKHPDAFLYLHSEMFGVDSGLNLVALAEICGIPPSSVGSTNQFALHLGVSDQQMGAIYSAMDVLANPSFGEGFGVPIIEAQACGTPVIVTDWTAMTELCGAGWLVEGDPYYDSAHGAFYKCPSVMEIIDGMEGAYEKGASMREEARAFAMRYDADRVMEEYWKPVLAELDGPREVAPLKPRVLSVAK